MKAPASRLGASETTYEEIIDVRFYGITAGAACHLAEGGPSGGNERFDVPPRTDLSNGKLAEDKALFYEVGREHVFQQLSTSSVISRPPESWKRISISALETRNAFWDFYGNILANS